ncbi:MAG: leucine--tRNA ligase [Acidimicrobiales bacterium]
MADVHTPTSDLAETADPAADADIPYRYTAALAAVIERRWQDRWAADKTFEAPNPAGPLADPTKLGHRPKRFVLDMFPYPSGVGLHVGHPLGYIGTDVYGRYRRMRGDNVLHAIGYDAFGLPAEQYAIDTGTHPRARTEENIANMRRQLRRLGLAHDERRSVATTDEDYYRWTQWIFLQIFNAWYDADADRARPIAELEAEFASGSRPSPTGRDWSSLSPTERAGVLDGYRLAYVNEAPVNWCPGLGTVVANEEVTVDGRSDRGNFPVFKRNMRQWMMRITAYADRLIDDLDLLDWPESIKTMQRNWIGRSAGARVEFGSPAGPITVFTTRPDTLFGATFMVLAPEHPLVDALTAPGQADTVAAYRREAAAKSDVNRQMDDRDKTGVFTGSSAVNPLNGAEIPVWIADYVLMGYGTGAIMAVPSGDQRDFEFARRFGLPVVATQMPPPEWFAERDTVPSADATTWPEAYVGEGVYVNSANNGLVLDGDRTMAEAQALTNAWLETNGHGEGTLNYRLRDWLFARQRYWGEPFPILWDADGVPHPVPEGQLPVTLPPLEDFKPVAADPDDAESEPDLPLGRVADWVNVTADLGDGPRTFRRDLNVMPQWAGSCWYELRYLDPTNEKRFVDPAVEAYWMGPQGPGHPGGVDLYVGGVEHAVLHLLYARFWHKVLFDLGLLSSREPYYRLFNQGYIQAAAYLDDRGIHVEASEVVEGPDGTFTHNGAPVAREFGKMGKSLKNAVAPDEIYAEYGADTLRLYEMAMGPFDSSRPWSTRDIVGMYRFLQRVWRNLVDEATGELTVTDTEPDTGTLRLLHQTMDAVGRDYDELRFNTSVAKLIELNNALTKVVAADGGLPRAIAEPFVLMLAPLVPHVAEELWGRLGHDTTLAYTGFPQADPALLVADSVEYPVQVNGKVRSRITVDADADAAAVEAAALADEKVSGHLSGPPKKVIVVPGKLVNVVV